MQTQDNKQEVSSPTEHLKQIVNPKPSLGISSVVGALSPADGQELPTDKTTDALKEDKTKAIPNEKDSGDTPPSVDAGRTTAQNGQSTMAAGSYRSKLPSVIIEASDGKQYRLVGPATAEDMMKMGLPCPWRQSDIDHALASELVTERLVDIYIDDAQKLRKASEKYETFTDRVQRLRAKDYEGTDAVPAAVIVEDLDGKAIAGVPGKWTSGRNGLSGSFVADSEYLDLRQVGLRDLRQVEGPDKALANHLRKMDKRDKLLVGSTDGLKGNSESALKEFGESVLTGIRGKATNAVKEDKTKTLPNGTDGGETPETPGIGGLLNGVFKRIQKVAPSLTIKSLPGAIWPSDEHALPTEKGAKKSDAVKEDKAKALPSGKDSGKPIADPDMIEMPGEHIGSQEEMLRLYEEGVIRDYERRSVRLEKNEALSVPQANPSNAGNQEGLNAGVDAGVGGGNALGLMAPPSTPRQNESSASPKPAKGR